MINVGKYRSVLEQGENMFEGQVVARIGLRTVIFGVGGPSEAKQRWRRKSERCGEKDAGDGLAPPAIKYRDLSERSGRRYGKGNGNEK